LDLSAAVRRQQGFMETMQTAPHLRSEYAVTEAVGEYRIFLEKMRCE
jgi:hypothetical protein